MSAQTIRHHAQEMSLPSGIGDFLERHSAIDLVIPLLCLVVCLAWGFCLPINCAPDEFMRLPIPFYIWRHGALPLGSDPEICNEFWGNSYGFTPYGNSLLAVPFMHLVSFLHLGTNQAWLIRAARVPSALCIFGATLLCEKIGKRCFRSPVTPYALALLVGLLPQVAFLGSYLNQDSLEIFATALIVYAWLVGIERRWDLRSCLLLAVALGICALSYYFAFIYLLASVAVYFATGRSMVGAGEFGKGRLWRRAVLITVVAIICGGWFYARNFVLYDGDIFGRATSAALQERDAIDWLKPSGMHTPKSDGMSIVEMMRGTYKNARWFTTTLKSFVGYFGYMTSPLSSKLYMAYAAVFAGGTLLAPLHLLRREEDTYEHKGVIRLALLVCAVTVFCFHAYYSWAVDYQPQGRYLMGALIPLAMLVASGFDVVGCGFYLQGRTGERLRKLGEGLLVLFLVAYLALAVYVMVRVAVPANCMVGLYSGGYQEF